MLNLDKMNEVISSLEQVCEELKNIQSTNDYLDHLSGDTKIQLEKVEHMLKEINSIKEETYNINQKTEKLLLDMTALLNEKIRIILNSITDSHNQYTKYIGGCFENARIETDKINNKIDYLKGCISDNQDVLLKRIADIHVKIEDTGNSIQNKAAENKDSIEKEINNFQEMSNKRFEQLEEMSSTMLSNLDDSQKTWKKRFNVLLSVTSVCIVIGIILLILVH